MSQHHRLKYYFHNIVRSFCECHGGVYIGGIDRYAPHIWWSKRERTRSTKIVRIAVSNSSYSKSFYLFQCSSTTVKNRFVCHLKPQRTMFEKCTNFRNGRANFDKISGNFFHNHANGVIRNWYFSASSVAYCTRGTHAPYCTQKVQFLHTDNYPCKADFVQWMLRIKNSDTWFPALVLFNDEENSTEKALSTCAVNTFGLTAIPTTLSLEKISRNFSWTSGQVTLVIA